MPAATTNGKLTVRHDVAPQDPGVAVLVVEDNEVNQTVAVELLAAFGVRAAIAENGLEGVQEYIALRPRVIFMDVSMPVMNGYAATQQIREYEGSRKPAAVPHRWADRTCARRGFR